MARSLTHLTRLSNMKVTINDAGNEASVTFPGFVLDDIDRTGNISIWRIQRYLSGARMAAYHIKLPDTGKTFLQYDELTENMFTFLASASTEVSRELYELPDAAVLPRLHTEVHLGYIGNSSLNSVAVLKDSDTGKVYARNVNQVVTVDKTTRKPTAMAAWWKEKYADRVIENQRLIIAPLDIPTGEGKTYSYEMKVPWGEIDRYRHTNYQSYIRFCFDAAMDAMQAGYYSRFPAGDDILRFHVKKMRIAFKGETKAGDNLLVRTWEDQDNPFLLHFDISRDGKTCDQNSLEFYEPNCS